jgi:hydrogenase maturation protein HypF
MVERAQITVTGVVQGVGFRPFVYALAGDLGLKGFVTNTAGGVLIDAEGLRLGDFLKRIPKEAPPLSRIAGIAVVSLPLHGYRDFQILKSIDSERAFTLVSPDVSICDDCLRELLDPRDRRYLYPFINCTNCGPRYSITTCVPYDRPNTTMAAFTMCPDCEREYHDPKDRRFHAQPNACPKCGPRVEFGVRSVESGVKGDNAMERCVRALGDGKIVAIKGLGGFHLACDAMNDAAVGKLRERKRKSNKPFAAMSPSAGIIRQFCEVNEEEQRLLESPQRPIVLLRKKPSLRLLSDAVSPRNQYVGCMLPYTPLHYLLFHLGRFDALVMTSGNLAEEPIVRDNNESVEKLSGIVDAFLLHNRDIFMRVDDSVARIPTRRRGDAETRRSNDSSPRPPVTVSPCLSFIRRSRGFAPDAIPLHGEGPEVLGCGADLKNTFTLTKGPFAIPSQHIGDMENYETLKFYEETLENLKSVYRVNPVAVAHDLHPGYLSTRWAIDNFERGTPHSVLRLFAIQHHYAHIGSVMAEHGLTGPVIGVACDGTGYGTDGNLWGGEFLIAGIDGFERAGQFKYVPLPGGEAAIRQPWRTAISYVREAVGGDAPDYLRRIGFMGRYGEDTVQQVLRVAQSPELSPLSSGAGRLFDAVAALTGVCDGNTFEGEAAMALEALTNDGVEGEYPFELKRENGCVVVDFSRTILSIIREISDRVPAEDIATKFHNTVASAVRAVVNDFCTRHSVKDVALSGGTFQNRYLLQRLSGQLEADGFNVCYNTRVPANDGGISLGQAYIVRERLKRKLEP